MICEEICLQFNFKKISLSSEQASFLFQNQKSYLKGLPSNYEIEKLKFDLLAKKQVRF